jgi:hypothetical protein
MGNGICYGFVFLLSIFGGRNMIDERCEFFNEEYRECLNSPEGSLREEEQVDSRGMPCIALFTSGHNVQPQKERQDESRLDALKRYLKKELLNDGGKDE